MDSIIKHPKYKLFHTSKENLEGLLHALDKAESTIDLEFFYLLPDEIGRQVLDILINKATQGVKVRILVDAIGSFSLSQSMYPEAFQKAGGHIRFFNSPIPFSINSKSLWYFRNHRRTVVIDNKELFVSSLCIGEHTKDWIETGILISNSQAIEEASCAFDTTWHKSLHKTFKIGSSSKISTDCFSYLTQAPLQSQRHIYYDLINRIRNANKTIILIAPYIIPDSRLIRALRQAKRRKVEVNIICPEKTDITIADLARNTYIDNLLLNNINIYMSKNMIHSKVAIFDNEVSHIGTMNLDNVSLRYNYEATLLIENRDCVEEMTNFVNKNILSNSRKIHLAEWRKRKILTKILEKLIWPIRKLL